MEITKHKAGDALELKVKGRLDAYWADHLSSELASVIREGARSVRLNLGEVDYLSSAGIRVLVQVYKQLKAIEGSFSVCDPSPAVQSILELAGLKQLLVLESAPAEAAPADVEKAGFYERGNVRLDVRDCSPQGSLKCQVIGEPGLLVGCRFSEEHCRSRSFPDSAFALGLGAFGSSFADCEGRFGEFLAAAGAVAYLPTDGSNVPDYMLAAGDFVPDVKVLYGIAWEGQFAKVAQFERKDEGSPVALSDIVEACLEIADTETVALAMLAESSGLMGTSLRRSPTRSAVGVPFSHPEVREWLSFTSERAFPRSLALVVGIAARSQRQPLQPFLRPLRHEESPVGHFHAAAFSYRPLKKGDLDLKNTVATLFEAENLQGILHLLSDDRGVVGAGQSEFVRGTCWIGRVSDIVSERR